MQLDDFPTGNLPLEIASLAVTPIGDRGGMDEDRIETLTPAGQPQEILYCNGIGTREDGETIPVVGELVVAARRPDNKLVGKGAWLRLTRGRR